MRRKLSSETTDAYARVLLVNETLARERFPAQNPIGRTVYLGGAATPFHIVGVVEAVRQRGLDVDAEPQVFVTLNAWAESQVPPGYYVVRSRLGMNVLTPRLRDVLRQLDATAVPEHIVSMQDVVTSALARPRMHAVLFGIFAALALTLAVIGIYGVMAYTVARSTRELAVRVALGAQPGEVLQMVLTRAAVLTGVGIALGLLGATATARYLQDLLYGLTPMDPRTVVIAAVLLAFVAMIGSYIPARRATRVDPLTALRIE